MRKIWKVALAFAPILLVMDMIMHIETDPKWVLGIYTCAWYLFGCYMGEAEMEEKYDKLKGAALNVVDAYKKATE